MPGNMAKSMFVMPFVSKSMKRGGALHMTAADVNEEPSFSIEGSTEPLEFKEHAFFDRTSAVNMSATAQEGLTFDEIASVLHQQGRHFKPELEAKIEPIEVTITGAAGAIGSSLVHFIAQGRMFGPYQRVNLRLLELPEAMKALTALSMDVADCAYPCLNEVHFYDTDHQA